MTARNFLLILTFALAAAMLVSAQDQQPTGGRPATSAPTSPPEGKTASPGPGAMTRNMAELNRFANMVLGTWSVRETHQASDMSPAGSSTGTALFHKGPGGMSVIENLSMRDPKAGRFTGLGVMWWDPQQQAYRGLWCDSMTPTCDTGSVAKWEGDNLIVRGSEQQLPDGSKLYMRDEYTNITPNSFTFTLYAGPSENALKPMMTMQYTRRSGVAPVVRPNTKQ